MEVPWGHFVEFSIEAQYLEFRGTVNMFDELFYVGEHEYLPFLGLLIFSLHTIEHK